MVDWLIVWGVTQAAGSLVRSVMQELCAERIYYQPDAETLLNKII